MADSKMLNRSWFHRLFGFQERCGNRRAYDQTRSQFEYSARTGELRCAARPGRIFAAGRFRRPSVEELRARYDHRAAVEHLDGGLRVAEVVGDISALHGLPGNRGALFQAASQLNTLEHTSEEGLPEEGITIYEEDETQGPSCAITCAPGLVVRNYFAFEDGEGQTRDRQVENLRDVEDVLDNRAQPKPFFKVVSGYTLASTPGLRALAQRLRESKQLQDDVVKKLRIGVQEDTEVVASDFGRSLREGPSLGAEPQLVSQAYCSAVSVEDSGCSAAEWGPFAQLVLEGAYEATLLAAVENARRHPERPGSRKVFLTALGGGAFGNEMSWIVAALSKAFNKFKDVGLEVHLVSFERPTPEFAGLLTKEAAAGPSRELPKAIAAPTAAAVGPTASGWEIQLRSEWEPLEAQMAVAIPLLDAARRQGEGKVHIKHVTDKARDYEFDIEAMTQRRLSTGTVRPIRFVGMCKNFTSSL